MPESTITESELHDPKSPYFDPTLSPDAMSGLHIRQYPGDIGASDIDRRDIESVDDSIATLRRLVNFDPTSPAVVLASVAHVAGVLTESEVARYCGRSYDLDYMEAAEGILAATITGNSKLGITKQVVGRSVTLDIDGIRAPGSWDAFVPGADGREDEHLPQIAAIAPSRSGIFSRLRLNGNRGGDIFPILGWQTTTTWQPESGPARASMFRSRDGLSVNWWGVIGLYYSADDAEQAMTECFHAVRNLSKDRRSARVAEHGPDQHEQIGDPIIP